jgi:hypothetical protein
MLAVFHSVAEIAVEMFHMAVMVTVYTSILPANPEDVKGVKTLAPKAGEIDTGFEIGSVSEFVDAWPDERT